MTAVGALVCAAVVAALVVGVSAAAAAAAVDGVGGAVVAAVVAGPGIAPAGAVAVFFFFGIYKTKRYIDTVGVHSWEPPGTSRYAQHQR